jgi:hypothetical protein
LFFAREVTDVIDEKNNFSIYTKERTFLYLRLEMLSFSMEHEEMIDVFSVHDNEYHFLDWILLNKHIIEFNFSYEQMCIYIKLKKIGGSGSGSGSGKYILNNSV